MQYMSNLPPTSEVVEDTPNSTAPSKKWRKRKTVRIELVVDEDEAKIIDDNAEKMYLNRSEYLRARGLKRVYTKNREVPPVEIIALIQILSELKRQGNNLNQMARRLNSGGSIAGADGNPFDLPIHLETTKRLLNLLREWQN
jgi:Bacterial mobilisation protein (MobC)